jgi:hypothetical protein
VKSRKFQARLAFTYDPHIHPDDATKAIIALINQMAKNRKRPTPESILEDLFISSLANKRPWSEKQIRQIAALSSNRNFCERFARALEEGRAKIFDPVDVFILSNWRDLRDPAFAKVLPGLQDWNPRAACGLIEHAHVKLPKRPTIIGEEWYSGRRKRLGLAGRQKYHVRDFIPIGNGQAKVITAEQNYPFSHPSNRERESLYGLHVSNRYRKKPTASRRAKAS